MADTQYGSISRYVLGFAGLLDVVVRASKTDQGRVEVCEGPVTSEELVRLWHPIPTHL